MRWPGQAPAISFWLADTAADEAVPSRYWDQRMSKVAWIGLGVMGFPMAGHLKTRGQHDVVVFNRTAAKADAWVAKFGGRSAPTPAEAASGAEFVFTCVGND